MTNRTHHEQSTMAVGEWSVEVDETIAPLIEALWRREIETVQACQHHSATGKVWISFASS